MNINEISNSIGKSGITMIQGSRGFGPETLFLIKDEFPIDIINKNDNFIEFLSWVCELQLATPATLLIKLDKVDTLVYNLWIDVCDSTHRTLLKNLTHQDVVSFVLFNTKNEVVKTFEINNSLKNNCLKLLDLPLSEKWDKPRFFEAVNIIYEKHSTPLLLWNVLSENNMNREHIN